MASVVARKPPGNSTEINALYFATLPSVFAL